MRFDVLTLFPEMFSGYLGQSLLKRAIDAGIVDVQIHNIRDWAQGKHRQVDDRPFGGGPGMVMRPEPVVESVEAVQQEGEQPGHLILLSPQGRRLDQRMVEELARHQRLVLVCGRYEGVDQRVIDLLAPDELSIGDYILGGGEVAAMVVIDAVVRLVPGVLGDEESNKQDSFSGEPPLLEFSQYTRPREYRGLKVPDVLMTGNHPEIARWREEQAQQRTQTRRADLLRGDEIKGGQTFSDFATEHTEATERLNGSSMSDPLTEKIIGAAIEVHRILGPGLLESVYEQALCHEFDLRGIRYTRQACIEMWYKDKVIKDQRVDLLVEDEDDRVVVDLKSLSQLPEISTAQVLSYLKATGLKRGLLINFGEKRLVDGVRRLSR